MQRTRVALVILLFTGGAGRFSAADQFSISTTTESWQEAIRLAADDTAAARFLAAYTLQTRAGWGDSPLIGHFSTPFSRVLQAAMAAHKKGDSLSADRVKAELAAPELHMIALSQPGATDDVPVAAVASIALTRRGAAERIEPLKTLELTKEYQEVHGTAFEGHGIVAVCPLSALAPDSEIRVVFDGIAQGSSPMSRCRECVIPINLARIR
jgi:hypothetical protein